MNMLTIYSLLLVIIIGVPALAIWGLIVLIKASPVAGIITAVVLGAVAVFVIGVFGSDIADAFKWRN